VFSGEYAAHPKRLGGMRSANTLEGALAEAAFLTGVERNADVVIMASYAPLLARVGYVQWAPDMIWFDAKTVYGTPSYHVQKMYSRNMGTYTLAMDAKERAALEEKSVFANASFDEKSGEIILKVVNAGKDDFVLDLVTEEELKSGTAVCLSGPDRYAYNTIEEPNKVSAKEWELTAEECKKLVLPAESFKVYRFTI
jgi:alpha-L-arabinofuranosidase